MKLKIVPPVTSPPKQPKTTSPAAAPKPKTPTSAIKLVPKDRPMPLKTPKSRQAEQAATVPPQQSQGDIRESVRVALCEQLINRIKLSEDFKLADDEVS